MHCGIDGAEKQQKEKKVNKLTKKGRLNMEGRK